jgi:hypothetical protein
MEKVDLLKLSWVVFSMEKGWRILRKNRNESMLGNLSNSSISNSFFQDNLSFLLYQHLSSTTEECPSLLSRNSVG